MLSVQPPIITQVYATLLKGPVINNGESGGGGDTKREEAGGGVPLQKRGNTKVLAMLKWAGWGLGIPRGDTHSFEIYNSIGTL